MVQQLGSRLFLRSDCAWVKLAEGPLVFPDPVSAITFCIRHGLRDVRLVANSQQNGKEIYVYPFGRDPAVLLERKRLRRFVAESRRLKRQQGILMAQLDLLQAEAKERKKQFPFKRRRRLSGFTVT